MISNKILKADTIINRANTLCETATKFVISELPMVVSSLHFLLSPIFLKISCHFESKDLNAFNPIDSNQNLIYRADTINQDKIFGYWQI